jgi:transcriptional regulator with XRE-family HTH domain
MESGDIHMNVGDRIRGMREKKQWSQLLLSEKLGIHNSVLSRIEAGKRPVEDELLAKISDVFDVSVDYLLGRTDDPTPPSEKSIDISVLRESAEACLTNNSHAGARLNDAETTIKLIEEEARKLGMSPSDPEFQKMLSHAFDLLRMARGENPK